MSLTSKRSDISILEPAFRYAIASLPNYKRSDCYAYVNALKARIKELQQEVDKLTDIIDSN